MKNSNKNSKFEKSIDISQSRDNEMMQNVEVEDALSSIHHNITEVCFLVFTSIFYFAFDGFIEILLKI